MREGVAGLAEKLDGMARAEAGASEEWRAAALAGVRSIAEQKDLFTADDVWPLVPVVGDEDGDSRAMGPIFSHAARNGWCKKVGKRKSQRTERHQGYVTVWASLLRKDTVYLTDAEAADRYRDALKRIRLVSPPRVVTWIDSVIEYGEARRA